MKSNEQLTAESTHLWLYLSALVTWGAVYYLIPKPPLNDVSAYLLHAGFWIFLIASLANYYAGTLVKSGTVNDVLLVLQLLGVFVAIANGADMLIIILLIIIASQLPYHFKFKMALTLLIVINVLSFVLFWSINQYHIKNIIIQHLLFFAFQLFALSVTRISVREKQAREKLTELNAELNSTRELLNQAARQDERVRISRDLHDVSGHNMTALILKLEYASQLEGSNKMKQQISESLDISRRLLIDLRHSIHEFRQENDLDLDQAVHALTTPFNQVNFDIDLADSVRYGSYTQTRTLLFCIQEAITNALRHAKADKIKITGTQEQDFSVLSIENNGRAIDSFEFGSGLNGMQERLQAIASSMQLEPSKMGGILTIKIAHPRVFPDD